VVAKTGTTSDVTKDAEMCRKLCVVAGMLLFGLSHKMVLAQSAEPDLMREASAVRAELARNSAALLQYTWTEHTEVFVSSDLKVTRDLVCRYDGAGKIVKTPAVEGQERQKSKAVSRRPLARSNADMRDYVERSISRIHSYVPPKPEHIDYLLKNGFASLGPSASGKSEIRFTHYFEEGDSFNFTYDSATKVLLRVNIQSTLGSPKDPVKLEAVFETLPDGPNHLSSATLAAPKRRIVVKMRNELYQRVAN
jgi:hypothetical protein